MKSTNHQYLEFADDVKKRYVKTRLEPIVGWRLNPRSVGNANERVDFILATPEDNLEFTPYSDGEPTKTKQVRFTYADEVLELYSDLEVRSFERMNRLLIENGLLVEYSEPAPEVDKTNALSDKEVKRIASLKTTANFKARIAQITSVHTLEQILKYLDDTEEHVPYAHVKAVRARIDELNAR